MQLARTAVDVHHASQRVGELAQAIDLIASLGLSVAVEIGCDVGGTLWAWRQICPDVYGITLPDNSHATGGQGGRLETHGATVHLGDSHDPAALAWLREQLAGRTVDVLIIDGDHTIAGVTADLDTYGPLVRPGGIILLHDILSRGDPRCEVWQAWPAIAARFPIAAELTASEPPVYGWGVLYVDGGAWT